MSRRRSSCRARCRRSAPSPARSASCAEQLKEKPVGAGLLIVGKVVNFRDHLRWFDSRPLFGRRALVMHSKEQPDDLADLLRSQGAEVDRSIPTRTSTSIASCSIARSIW